MELILGAIVSVIAQFSKKIFGTGEWQTLGTVAVLSLVAAGVYQLLNAYDYWGSVQQILITAGAFYSFVILRFSGASNSAVSES
jgi:hypothetical protein